MISDENPAIAPPRRAGKSLHNACLAAAALRNGKRVLLATSDGLFPIVSVPGFPDGTQLVDQGSTTPAAPQNLTPPPK